MKKFCLRDLVVSSIDSIPKTRINAGEEGKGEKREILLINTRSFAYAIFKKSGNKENGFRLITNVELLFILIKIFVEQTFGS